MNHSSTLNAKQLTLFDTEGPSGLTHILVERHNGNVRALDKSLARDVVKIGMNLIGVQERMPHGHFLDWVENKLGWGRVTTWRFMNVARAVAKNADITDDDLDNLNPGALFRLCAPSAHSLALKKAVHLARNGVEITISNAKLIAAGQDTALMLNIATEEDLERALCKRLSQQGIAYKRQVVCAVGRADVVTADAIYEVKHPITRKMISQAVGQVLMYRSCINQDARAVVVFVKTDTEMFAPFIRAASQAGVEILQWT